MVTSVSWNSVLPAESWKVMLLSLRERTRRLAYNVARSTTDLTCGPVAGDSETHPESKGPRWLNPADGNVFSSGPTP